MADAAKPLTIALVAGETSGDNLGGPLLQAIAERHPGARFVGIGGPRMIEAGLENWVDLERLSVNGFVDPLLRLPELVSVLLRTRRRVVEAEVDCFIGVDFNFFNLLLERLLKRSGVRTVHYVSPTVWAWREGRIEGIAKSVDLMLALYPFETTVYERHGIDVRFVGHPRADEIAPGDDESSRRAARLKLGFEESDRVVAVLPGSRSSEVRHTGPDFLRAAREIHDRWPDVRFALPAANDRRRAQVEVMKSQLIPELDVLVTVGNAPDVMRAADVVLVNSGTATLEAMLLRRPMVMSYRLGPVTYAIVSRLVRTPWFALPNILAQESLVPEFIQGDATPEALAAAVCRYLEAPDHSALMARFDEIHQTLRCNAGARAADAVLEFCGRGEAVADVES